MPSDDAYSNKAFSVFPAMIAICYYCISYYNFDIAFVSDSLAAAAAPTKCVSTRCFIL